MKAILAIGICVTAIVLIAVGIVTRSPTSPEQTHSSIAKWSHKADEELTDSAEVFKKAFWAHPLKEDKIEHAVRLHWLDDGEVYKWQWFIHVHPSPELVEKLIKRNSFRLDSSSDIELPSNPPTWFSPPANGQTLSSPDQEMTIWFDPESSLIVAWGQGKGFTQNVAAPPQKPANEVIPQARRLPNSRPPTDRKTKL
ncbi:hypothetical protein [Rubritalea profundi]|uniref:Uncharacterized protein n=1 Tax=Rubritalea profundi TaxID=1658618 RepID=A0A2S7TZ86_9BACT|nr:hypothetical protein [Rubritalea profundi]PQJ27531.1 hypothetical protein BSZ32_02820 [Rubritalea profundi]